MKNILSKSLIAIFAMIMGVSCVKKETFHLKGTVKNTPEGELLIYKLNDNKVDTLAYTYFTNGAFEIDSLWTPIEEATYATIILRPKKSDDPAAAILYKRIPVILENKKMTAEFAMDTNDQIFEGSPYHTKVSNFDTSNEEMVLLNKTYKDGFDNFQTLRKTSKDTALVKQTGKTVSENYQKFRKKKEELIIESISKSEDTVYNAFLLVQNAYIVDPAVFVDQANQILPVVQNLNKSVTNDLTTHKVKFENQLKASVGNPYTDFSISNMMGDKVTLSELIKENEYVLLDFWASWCAPCRAEIPNLKKAYSEYNPKGFGIFMVSIDRDKEKWETASTEENFPWINGLDRNGVQGTYAVSFIPQNFLIDKNGIIVGKNLRGEGLEQKLKELIHSAEL